MAKALSVLRIVNLGSTAAPRGCPAVQLELVAGLLTARLRWLLWAGYARRLRAVVAHRVSG